MNRDYFAEMYVAGILADRNWNVYFPRRDRGFDMIITKETETGMLLRPVQVKGKYPQEAKTNKSAYGYIGQLSQLHPDNRKQEIWCVFEEDSKKIRVFGRWREEGKDCAFEMLLHKQRTKSR